MADQDYIHYRIKQVLFNRGLISRAQVEEPGWPTVVDNAFKQGLMTIIYGYSNPVIHNWVPTCAEQCVPELLKDLSDLDVEQYLADSDETFNGLDDDAGADSKTSNKDSDEDEDEDNTTEDDEDVESKDEDEDEVDADKDKGEGE